MNRCSVYRLSDLPQGEVVRVGRGTSVPLVIGAIAPRLGARIRQTSLSGGQSMTSNEEGLDDLGAVGRILAPTSEGHIPERLGVSITSYPHPTPLVGRTNQDISTDKTIRYR